VHFGTKSKHIIKMVGYMITFLKGGVRLIDWDTFCHWDGWEKVSQSPWVPPYRPRDRFLCFCSVY